MHLSTARFKSCSDTFGLSVRGAAVPSPSPRPILRRGRCKRPPHRQPPPATLPTVALTSPPLRRRTAGSPGERNAPHSACAVGVAVLVSSDPIRPAAAASRLRLTGQPAGPPDHLAGRRASSGRPRPPLGLWLSCMLLPWPAHHSHPPDGSLRPPPGPVYTPWFHPQARATCTCGAPPPSLPSPHPESRALASTCPLPWRLPSPLSCRP